MIWYRLGAAAAVLMTLGLAYNHYADLVDDKARLTAELYQQRTERIAEREKLVAVNMHNLQTIHRMELQAREDADTLAHHVEKMERVTAQRDAERAKLDSWRDTLYAETLKRPDVVARAARIAINRSMRYAAGLTAARNGEGDDPGSGNAETDAAATTGGTADDGNSTGRPNAERHKAMER